MTSLMIAISLSVRAETCGNTSVYSGFIFVRMVSVSVTRCFILITVVPAAMSPIRWPLPFTIIAMSATPPVKRRVSMIRSSQRMRYSPKLACVPSSFTTFIFIIILPNVRPCMNVSSTRS